jgi:alginate O-acetyltransferase complex protein AlgI
LTIFANPLFESAHRRVELGVLASWLAAVSFTFQVYFDFSGYSDMAIGLARMLGVKLPLNFHSPLRASSITAYWRRWHMTLQRFIVAYIYQPLSLPLNRFAAAAGLRGWSAFAVAVGGPLFVTFVVVGIWHGAGWTYVLFGVLHAIYVCVCEAWREFEARGRRRLKRAGRALPQRKWWHTANAHVLTLIAVLYANVLFRASTVGDALFMWKSMTGLSLPATGALPSVSSGMAVTLIVSGLLAFLAPNTQQIMGRFDPAHNWREWRDVGRAPLHWTWKPSAAGLVFAGLVLFLGVIFIERGRAVFLYFNF